MPALRLGVIGLANYELFDLLELVDPEQTTNISAATANLSQKARRDPGIHDGQAALVQDLARVQTDEGNLSGASQEKVVFRNFVRLLPTLREHAASDERRLLHQGRH